MAHIILFGGHGRIALLTEPLLAARGDQITAVIRNPDHAAEVTATGATPLLADIEHMDTDAIAELIAGHDAVVWSAGAGGGNSARTRAVDQDAAIRAIDAAEWARVKRFVMVSYFNADPDHGVDPSHPFFAYAEAKAAADAHLRSSDLDWTILGPSTLTHDPGTGMIDTAATESTRVSRADVAEAIAATLVDESTVNRTIRFNEGTTPIAVALRSNKA